MKGVLLKADYRVAIAEPKVQCSLETHAGMLPAKETSELAELLASVYPEEGWTEKKVQETFVLDARVKRFWTIRVNGNIVAVAAAQFRAENGPQSMNVHWISVAASMRRLGLGEKLVELIWEFAAFTGKKTLYAYSRTFTEGVERFYTALNFTRQ